MAVTVKKDGFAGKPSAGDVGGFGMLAGCGGRKLTFGVLESLAGFGLAGFLALDGSRIAGQKSFLPHLELDLGIQSGDSPGNAVTDGLGLTCNSPASDCDIKIISAVVLDNGQDLRGGHGVPQISLEEIIDGLMIDRDLAAGFRRNHAHLRRGRLSSAHGLSNVS